LTLIFGHLYLGDKYTYILYLLPLIFLAPITSLYDGIYRGLKRFKQLAIISLIVGIFSLVFVYVLIKQYNLIGALIAQNIFYFILFLALAFGYKEFNFKLDTKVMKEIGRYSLIIGLGNLGYFIYSRIDIIFLGHYGFIEQINYFEIINKIIMLFLIPFTILGQVISPSITKLYLKKDYFGVRNKFKKYLIFSLVSSIITVFIIFLFSKFFLSYFLREYFNQTMIEIMYLMLIVFFTQFLNGIIPFMTVATGHAKLNTLILIIFGIFHVFLNYIFINYYGFIGVAYSIVITKVLADLIFIYSYYNIIKKLK
jgi:PST family polysaccharide transporter